MSSVLSLLDVTDSGVLWRQELGFARLSGVTNNGALDRRNVSSGRRSMRRLMAWFGLPLEWTTGTGAANFDAGFLERKDNRHI